MRGVKFAFARGAVLMGALLLATASAQAGEVTAVVTVPEQNVTWSFGDSKPVAIFKVKFTNKSLTASTQNARFLATTSVAGGVDASVRAEFATPANPDPNSFSCTATTFERTTVDCVIGVLAPNTTTPEFTLAVVAPTSGTSVGLHWEAIFNSGDSPGISNGESGDVFPPLALAPRSSSEVKTIVPVNTALFFFTGTGIATPGDPWVTRVKIPGGQSETLATVLEQSALIDCARAADVTTCNTTNLTIPLLPGVTYGVPGTGPTLGYAQYIEITLLRDASTIARNASISSATVSYQKDATSDKLPVPSCALNPDLPQPGKPCEDLTKRKQFPKKSTGKTPVEPGFESDWQFVIYATDNGRYDQ